MKTQTYFIYLNDEIDFIYNPIYNGNPVQSIRKIKIRKRMKDWLHCVFLGLVGAVSSAETFLLFAGTTLLEWL